MRCHGARRISGPNAMTETLHSPMTVEFWMGDVINLRGTRKRNNRLRDEQRAAANRLLHGRSKAERNLQAARDAKVRRDLEMHRVDRGDER